MSGIITNHPNAKIRHPETPNYEVFKYESSKANRKESKPRYDLITPEFLKSIGDALALGAKNYGEGNWRKGDEAYGKDCCNHAIEHIIQFMNGDRSEDHLGHAAVNLMFIMRYSKDNPTWFNGK